MSAPVAEQLRQQAAALLRLADELDGAGEVPPLRLIETGPAMVISGMSSSWLYANARKYGFGWRLPTRAWRFDEAALRAFCENKETTAN